MTLQELQKLFKNNPLGGQTLFRPSKDTTNNKDIDPWYIDESFYKSPRWGEIKLQWALVKKTALEGSLD